MSASGSLSACAAPWMSRTVNFTVLFAGDASIQVRSSHDRLQTLIGFAHSSQAPGCAIQRCPCVSGHQYPQKPSKNCSSIDKAPVILRITIREQGRVAHSKCPENGHLPALSDYSGANNLADIPVSPIIWGQIICRSVNSVTSGDSGANHLPGVAGLPPVIRMQHCESREWQRRTGIQRPISGTPRLPISLWCPLFEL